VAISLAMKGGSLFSLNRYLIPGAAFVLCLVHFIRMKWTRKELIRLAVAVFIFMGLVHAFRHIRVILESIGIQLYLMLFLLYNNSRYRRLIFSVLYLTGLIIQVCLADMLSRFMWVA
jgi:hypothetical protein